VFRAEYLYGSLSEVTKAQLREQYLVATEAYLEEVKKTKVKAMDANPIGFSEQLRKERAAEQHYKETQRAYFEAPWD
jgi:hypothetical protein